MWAAQQKKHSHGPTYRANTATLHRRAVDSMSRGGGERGMHHTLPSTSISTYFDQKSEERNVIMCLALSGCLGARHQ